MRLTEEEIRKAWEADGADHIGEVEPERLVRLIETAVLEKVLDAAPYCDCESVKADPQCIHCQVSTAVQEKGDGK